MKFTDAQRRLLLRAIEDGFAAKNRDGWHAVNPSEYSACRALFKRGLIEMVWGKGPHKQFIRPTDAGRAAIDPVAEAFAELERREANLVGFRGLRSALAA